MSTFARHNPVRLRTTTEPYESRTHGADEKQTRNENIRNQPSRRRADARTTNTQPTPVEGSTFSEERDTVGDPERIQCGSELQVGQTPRRHRETRDFRFIRARHIGEQVPPLPSPPSPVTYGRRKQNLFFECSSVRVFASVLPLRLVVRFFSFLSYFCHLDGDFLGFRVTMALQCHEFRLRSAVANSAPVAYRPW